MTVTVIKKKLIKINIKKKQEKIINKNQLIRKKKSYRPRVRVRGNSDSKKKTNRKKIINQKENNLPTEGKS